MALVVAAAICCGAAVGPIAAVADATAPSVAAAAAATAPPDPAAAAAAAAPAADLAAVAPALAAAGCSATGTDALVAIQWLLADPEFVLQSRLVLLELRCGWNCKVWQLQSCQCQQVCQLPPSLILLLLMLLLLLLMTCSLILYPWE